MDFIPDEKLCRKCGAVRPLTRFHAQQRGLYGKSSQCIDCQNEARNKRRSYSPGKSATAMRAWKAKNPEKVLNNKLKAAYGITLAQYNALLAEQGGCCAICGFPPELVMVRRQKRLHVDHCHNSGVVRGLLCGNCNVALGNFQDNIEVVKRAVAYLESRPPSVT